MKAFVFPLESVLTVRERELDTAKEVFARAEKERAELEHVHDAAVEDLEGYLRGLQEQRSGRSGRNDQMIYLNAVSQQQDRCRQLRELLAAASSKAATAHAALVDAQRKREILVRMKERQELQHKNEQQREALSLVDDLINAREVLRLRRAAL